MKFIYLIFYRLVFLLIAIGLSATSLTIFPNSLSLYTASFAALIIITVIAPKPYWILCKRSIRYLILILSISLTNLFNDTFDYRFALFLLILAITAPVVKSPVLYKFKGYLIQSILLVFWAIVFSCFVCYIIGYNGPIDLEAGYNPLDFKGITVHPMWLAPICGVTNIVLLYLFFRVSTKTYKIVLLLFLAISFYMSFVAASRSSLLASSLSMLCLSYFWFRKKTHFLRILLVALVTLFIALPYMDTERMQGKMETQKDSGQTSRNELWKQRVDEISYSPILGVGFATSGIGKNKETGRTESGSGWLAVMSQTGLLGFACLLSVYSCAMIRLRYLREKKDLLLLSVLLLFLSVHSFFEGYIYTPGYNLCFLFWLLIGYLCEANENIKAKQLGRMTLYGTLIKKNDTTAKSGQLLHRLIKTSV